MNKPLSPNPGCIYEIRLEGRLAEDWSEWFGGLSLQVEGASTTLLRGCLPDQAALLGVLNKLHALNLSLLSVRRCPATPNTDKKPNTASCHECGTKDDAAMTTDSIKRMTQSNKAGWDGLAETHFLITAPAQTIPARQE